MKQSLSITLIIALFMTAFSGLFSHSAHAAPVGTKLTPTYATHSDDSVVRNAGTYEQIGNYVVSSQSSKAVTINVAANPGKKIKSLIWYDRNGGMIRNAAGSWANKLTYTGSDTLSGIKLSAKGVGGSPSGGIYYWDRATGTNEWKSNASGGVTYTSSSTCPSAPTDTWGYKSYPNCTDNQLSALLVKDKPYLIQDSSIAELHLGRIEDNSVVLSTVKPVDIDVNTDFQVTNTTHGGSGRSDPTTQYLGVYDMPTSKNQITIRFQQTFGSNSLDRDYYKDWASASARQMWYYYAFTFAFQADTYLYKDKQLYVEWVNVDVVVIPPDEEEPDPTPEPEPDPNQPPVAVIMAPSEVLMGDVFTASGYGSYDPDGTIEQYYWGTVGATGTITGASGPIYYTSIGEKRLTLAVIDNEGAGNGTEKLINVLPPYVYAQMTVGGTKKENRKVTLSSSTDSPSMYPVVETKWTITAISGGTASDIKIKGALTQAAIETLFKKAGSYKVSFYARNSAGYTDTEETILEIVPDLQPVSQFSVPTWIYRNSADSNFALMDIKDTSKSNDGDLIKIQVLTISYNDNDNYYPNSIAVDVNDPEPGLKAKTIFSKFDDDPLLDINILTMNVNQTYSYTTNGITITALKKTDGTLQLKSKHVGRYLIEMRVTEDFGQPTIPEFIIASDYRSNSTASNPLLEKVLTIDNRAPTVNFKP